MHIVVNSGGRAKVGTFFGGLDLTTLAQFAGCKDERGFGWSDAMISGEVMKGELAQGVEVVIAVGENAFHEVNGVFLVGARADE